MTKPIRRCFEALKTFYCVFLLTSHLNGNKFKIKTYFPLPSEGNCSVRCGSRFEPLFWLLVCRWAEDWSSGGRCSANTVAALFVYFWLLAQDFWMVWSTFPETDLLVCCLWGGNGGGAMGLTGSVRSQKSSAPSLPRSPSLHVTSLCSSWFPKIQCFWFSFFLDYTLIFCHRKRRPFSTMWAKGGLIGLTAVHMKVKVNF